MSAANEDSMLLLSVITVCFNAEETIADTLQSIGDQDCPDFEHVVIDGLSRDRTCELVDSLRTPRTRLISEVDRGLYDAMNKGLRLARGRFTCFLNADDVYASRRTLSHVCACLRRGGVDVAYGDIEFVDPHDSSQVTRRWIAGAYTRRSVELGWHPPHPGFFARTDLLRSLGGFCLDLPIAADYELMLKVLLQPGVRGEYLGGPLVRMREGGRSTGGLRSHLIGNWQSFRAMHRNGLRHPAVAASLKPLRKLLQFVPRLARGLR
jgi:glycosyltransferase involved in cell wall biosynthesis